MATTYKLIDKAILTGSQSSVSFTGLGSYSSDYTDLLLKLSVRSSDAANDRQLFMTFNGDNSSKSSKVLRGSGSAASSYSSSDLETGRVDASGSTSNTFSNIEIYIPNYYSSNYKSASSDGVTENNATTAYAELAAHLWSNTTGIYSVGFAIDGGSNFVSGSSFYLYGIKNS